MPTRADSSHPDREAGKAGGSVALSESRQKDRNARDAQRGASRVVDGTAHVADEEELAEVEWCNRRKSAEYVPHPLFGPVQDYLEASLA